MTIIERERTWTHEQHESVQVTRDTSYDLAWQDRMRALELISLEGLHSHSSSWPHTPKLQTYRELTKEAREQLGSSFGAVLAGATRGPVISVEKPYLAGFVDGFSRAAGGCAAPFVLLALNGGDEPLTAELQQRVASLRANGLVACYACNLHRVAAEHAGLFRPLPIGVCSSLRGAEPNEAPRLGSVSCV